MIASWQESYDKSRQCVEKQRHHFADDGLNGKGYGLSSGHIWLWELDHEEGRVLKNWCLQTVVLEKTLEKLWTARRSKQSILKEINPEYPLEWLMLKLQYFVHLCKQLTHWKRPWCRERLRAGGEESIRGPDGWMASLVQWIWTWANFRRWWGTGRPGGVLQSTGLQGVRLDWVTEQPLKPKPGS